MSENEYSPTDSMVSLKRAVEDTKHVLELIRDTDTTDFSEGTVKAADLDKITIGKEDLKNSSPPCIIYLEVIKRLSSV